jgi:hypothetical protein
MANILIKVGASLILFINIYNPIVKADSENLKQCFYRITEYENSKALNEDLRLLNNMEIPVFVVINPNENINKNVIAVLEKFQKEANIGVLLENNSGLEKSYFAVKEYDNRIHLSGLCNIQKDKLVYIGEKNISFDLMEITADPLETMTKVNIEKEYDVNYALVVNGDSFNISTLLLAYNELQGLPLEVSNYSFHLKKPALIYEVFTHVGDITIVFFSISIVIFVISIVIFKKWSREKFLD